MDQLLLNIHPNPKKTLENFVVGKNAECLSSIKKLLTSDELFFIYIWGEDGSGKSHLATALKNQKITVVEDVEILSDREQIDLFNLFNESKKTNTKLVITGSESPNNLNLRRDVSSRLNWQLVYQLKTLTDNEKKIALTKHAEGKGIVLDKKIIDYCMANLNRDLHFLIATIDALDEWLNNTLALAPFSGLNTLEKADFVSWNELSLNYQFTGGILDTFNLETASLGISGRNLAIFTGYTGVDPRINFVGRGSGSTLDQNFGQGIAAFGWPVPRQAIITLKVGF